MDGDCPSAERAGELRDAVKAKYRQVSARPEGQFPYPVGRESAIRLGYEPRWLDSIPREVVDRFVGVGNPFRLRHPARGESVLDLGCGCGLDVFVAALFAGTEGRSVGVDMTREMLEWPRKCAGGWASGGVDFKEGAIEALPFGNDSFDMVISNGVLNLVPDKDAAFREIHRVLKPGGTFAAADLIVAETVPPDVLASMDAWST